MLNLSKMILSIMCHSRWMLDGIDRKKSPPVAASNMNTRFEKKTPRDRYRHSIAKLLMYWNINKILFLSWVAHDIWMTCFPPCMFNVLQVLWNIKYTYFKYTYFTFRLERWNVGLSQLLALGTVPYRKGILL